MRERSVDVLRGLAILGMVLSGTISRNAALPAWLYHAQIPPPYFKFNPALPGITWVDLVFPFFIFSMGVAIPFSLGNLTEKGSSFASISRKISIRALRLFVFALMLGQLSPWQYAGIEGYYPWAAALLAFIAFFLAFGKLPLSHAWQKTAEAGGYVLMIGLLVIRHLFLDLPFSFNKNDIIILVLANLALFGGIIWLLSREKPLTRLAILAVVVAWRLTHGVEGSVNQWLWSFTPAKTLSEWFPWLNETLKPIGDLNKTVFYNPEFLKYLLILIPGMLAGDLLRSNKAKPAIGNAAAIAFAVVIVANTWLLFARQLNLFWAINLICGLILLNHKTLFKSLHGKDLSIALWSYAWLLLGTVFEAWEGGIKKDPSTYSYLLLTAGLSGFSLLVFRHICSIKSWSAYLEMIEKTGMNPMIGYVVVSYAIAPLLQFAQLLPWMDGWHLAYPWLGVLRGLALTLLMLLAAQWFTNKKLYWKT